MSASASAKPWRRFEHRASLAGRPTTAIGMRFDRLIVFVAAEPYVAPASGAKFKQWWCLCDCKTWRLVTDQALRSGNTRSCGCLAREHRKAS